ncbi:enolase C-terminal domain-like protein [Kiloniella sp. b19]|uniref:enolase C-terminal domain-like protein n=1 Tax=Kiloniella sp. GXU_MW_B19 TaxID=3141326 RepID=UPI0031D7CC01
MTKDLHKIVSGEVYIVDLPVTEVHSHGSGDVKTIRSVLLELTTDSGLTGWGEASPWAVFTGTVESNAAALKNYFIPAIIGRSPFDVEVILDQMDRMVVHASEAKAALEMALLDLTGKALDTRVCDLLGGAHREKSLMSFSIANPDFDQDFAKVQRMVEDGVRIFKFKTGFKDHAFDLMRVEKIRSEFGDLLDLRIDYNQGMKAQEALPKLKDFESFGLSFIEQPVPRDNLEAMKHFTHVLTTPVMADESVFNPREALVGAQMRVADIFSLKVMKSGGIRKALQVAAIARAAGIGVYGGCMFETGIAHAAGAHLMACAPELELSCEFYMANYYLREDILEETFPVKNGYVHVPEGKGLGVNVDRSKLEHYGQRFQ